VGKNTLILPDEDRTMLMEQAIGQAVEEGTCAECGRVAGQRERCFDQHTLSELELCATCFAAFRQRQAFPPGCCD
jgi:hypothetical protein